jgi:tetratricopeptide (TPR) repeat protein
LFEPDDQRGETLREVARDLLLLGRPKEAIPLLERALALDPPRGPGVIADDWFELGRARWDAGDHAPGLTLVRKARDAYVSHPDWVERKTLGDATTWLAAHDR